MLLRRFGLRNLHNTDVHVSLHSTFPTAVRYLAMRGVGFRRPDGVFFGRIPLLSALPSSKKTLEDLDAKPLTNIADLFDASKVKRSAAAKSLGSPGPSVPSSAASARAVGRVA